MKTVTLYSQKGGVGKTSSVFAFASASKFKGYKTLVIDLDGQSNVSLSLRGSSSYGNSYELLTQAKSIEECIQTTPLGIDLVVGSQDLAALSSYKGSANRLKCVLETVSKNYDYCFIDLPPLQSEMLFNALVCSDLILCPVACDVYSLQGLKETEKILKLFKQTNKKLTCKGYFFTAHNPKIKLNQIVQQLFEKESELKCIGSVRKSIVMSEALSTKNLLYEYSPKSTVATDYMSLFENYIEK